LQRKKVTLPPGRHKIIILDEADSMTSGSQQALRRIMEIHSNTTRFALACNQSTKIIEPIQSRCAVLRFTRLSDAQILKRLREVAAFENVTYTDDGMEALLFAADGDMRQALNNLQATHSGFGHINQQNVNKVVDIPHPHVVKELIGACVKGSFKDAYHPLEQLWKEGYSSIDIISTLFRITKIFNMPEYQKLEFLKEIGFCNLRASSGVNTLVQLSGLLSRLCIVSENMKK